MNLNLRALITRWLQPRAVLTDSAAVTASELTQGQRLEHLEHIISQIPGMVFQCKQTPDGLRSFPYVSDGIKEIYGFSPEQVRLDSQCTQQLVHPDDLQRLNDSIARSASTLSIWHEEYRVLHPQHGQLWLEGKALPQAQADGSLLWYGVINDISARKRSDANLSEERQRLSSIIEGSHLGTWEWNVQTGSTVFNQRWAEILGYRLDELAPQDVNTWRTLAHPDDLKLSDRLLERHFSGELADYDCQCRMRHKEGHWAWVQVRGRLISRTAEGLPLLMYGTHSDISGSHQQAEEIQQARAFLQAMVDSSTEVAMIATDPQGLIVLFNSGAQRLLGYRAEEMIGRHTPTVFHLADEVRTRAQALSAELGRPIQGFEVFIENSRSGTPETRHWTYVRKDGQQRQVNLTVSAIHNKLGEVSGFLGIATDISALLQTTQALQDSEQRFRGMIGNLPGAVYRCRNDANWSMLHISAGIERLTGYPAADFIEQRRSYASIILPSELWISQVIQSSLAAREVFELTYRIRHADGHIVWVSEKGRGEFTAEGQLLWLDGFIWDISEQHLAECARLASEAKLSTLYNMAPVAIALNRLRDGQLIESNPQLEQLTGYSMAELRELDAWQLTSSEYAAQEPQLLAALNQRGTYGPYETVFVRKDGRRVPVLLHGARVTSTEGEPLVWTIIQDISERVTAEQQIRDRESYLRTVLDNIIDAIFTIAEDGLIESCNLAGEHMFALTQAQLIGRPAAELIAEPYRQQYLQHIREQLALEPHALLDPLHELEGLRSDGECFALELALSRISHNGRQQLVAVVRDVTERKRVERMKNEFVSSVSHELRTPLTSIAGALGLICGGALGAVTPGMLPMLNIAHQNSLRLSSLINDLLDMDKLVAGKMHFDLRAHPLMPLLAQSLAANQAYADEYAVHWQIVEGIGEVAALLDEQRFLQVMANLLSNAAKYSPRGGLVTVRAQLDAGQVYIEVCDQGAGIAAEFQARIFSKFEQADSSDSRQKGGTGLGLAISRELVERMHGQIGFSSSSAGTRFWFRLPLAEV